MARYEVLAPFAHVNDDGTATIHRDVGAIIDLPEEFGDTLPDAVSKLRTEPVEPEPEAEQPPNGQPAVIVEEKRNRGGRGKPAEDAPPVPPAEASPDAG